MLSLTIKRQPSKNAVTAFNDYRTQIEAAFFEIADKQIQERAKITRTWKKSSDKPVFIPILSIGKTATLKLELNATAAESATLSVWQLLDRGTSVRYMQLSNDWQSKTSPRTIGSTSGAGRKLGVNTGKPNAGIAAREFDETVNAALEGFVDDAIEDAIERGLRAAQS